MKYLLILLLTSCSHKEACLNDTMLNAIAPQQVYTIPKGHAQGCQFVIVERVDYAVFKGYFHCPKDNIQPYTTYLYAPDFLQGVDVCDKENK